MSYNEPRRFSFTIQEKIFKPQNYNENNLDIVIKFITNETI